VPSQHYSSMCQVPECSCNMMRPTHDGLDAAAAGAAGGAGGGRSREHGCRGCRGCRDRQRCSWCGRQQPRCQHGTAGGRQRQRHARGSGRQAAAAGQTPCQLRYGAGGSSSGTGGCALYRTRNTVRCGAVSRDICSTVLAQLMPTPTPGSPPASIIDRASLCAWAASPLVAAVQAWSRRACRAVVAELRAAVAPSEAGAGGGGGTV
jgi:hypothetical protein